MNIRYFENIFELEEAQKKLLPGSTLIWFQEDKEDHLNYQVAIFGQSHILGKFYDQKLATIFAQAVDKMNIGISYHAST